MNSYDFTNAELDDAKAHAQKRFGRIAVYACKPDVQFQLGLDCTSDQLEPVDFVAEFNRLRHPIFPKPFYHQQWLALSELAQKRGETNETYCQQISEFIALFGQ